MTSSLRIPAEMLKSWMDALASRTDLRGAAAVAKEMEAHLSKAGSDGHVVVPRHQLFTWGESVAGLARRAQLGSPVQGVADDIRAVLGGRDVPGGSAGRAPAAGTPPPAFAERGPAPYAPPAPSSYPSSVPVAPVTYVRGGGQGGGGGIRLVPEGETHLAVGNILREARHELLIVSPWALGLETLVNDLLHAPPNLALRIVSRRPDKEDETYFRAVRDLQRRRADVVMSPFLHTRMLIADGEVLLLGTGGLPKPGFNAAREAAVLTSDAATVGAARAHFERIFAEAKGGPPR